MSLFTESSELVEIRDVWEENLEEEFMLIRQVVDSYPYAAMDTEFPGMVTRPVGNFPSTSDYNYASLKGNVDMLKLIQLGLTLFNESGHLPTIDGGRGIVWQFNFRDFDPSRDMCAQDSIELLIQCGIDFKKNLEKGVSSFRFAELLMSSGVVLNDSVRWVTFHSAYDFGYLLKLLSGRHLPSTQDGFFTLIQIFFPVVYDIKHLMKFCNGLYGGLSKVAEQLGVKRIGTCHQAGSDSLLTASVFQRIKALYFKGSPKTHSGVLYGLGADSWYLAHWT